MASFSSSGRSAGCGFLPLNILKSSIKKRWWGLGRLPWHLVHWHQPLQLWATFLADGNWKVWTTWALVNNSVSIQMTLWAFCVQHPLFLLFTFYPSQHHDLIHSNEVSSIAKNQQQHSSLLAPLGVCKESKNLWVCQLSKRDNSAPFEIFSAFLSSLLSTGFFHTCWGMHPTFIKLVHHQPKVTRAEHLS